MRRLCDSYYIQYNNTPHCIQSHQDFLPSNFISSNSPLSGSLRCADYVTRTIYNVTTPLIVYKATKFPTMLYYLTKHTFKQEYVVRRLCGSSRYNHTPHCTQSTIPTKLYYFIKFTFKQEFVCGSSR